MALLDSPQDPDDVWQALGDDVPPHRLLMQGLSPREWWDFGERRSTRR